MAGFGRSCVPQNICSVKVTSSQSSEQTIFAGSGQDALFHSVSTCSKKSSTKRFVRLMIPATDFPVAGLPAMGSIVFCNAASTSDRSRDSVRASPVSCCCAMVLCSVFPSLYRRRKPCQSYAVPWVPPASGGIVHARCRFLQLTWRMICFW